MWIWYVARASGLVSLVLLTGSVLLGILSNVHWASERWPRFSTAMLHRNLSLLAVVFLGVHIATVVVDGFAPISWVDAVVPFASPYRTLWLGLGTVAFDLVLALIATSLMRRRIGPRVWRAVHWLAYLCWPVALVHGLGTGTDTASVIGLALSVACAAAVIAAAWWRLSVTRPGAVRTWAAAGSVALPVLVAAWLLQGPLAPGWAARAGTPGGLLAASTAVGTSAAGTSVAGASISGAPAPTAAAGALSGSFSSSFRGTATTTTATGGAVTVSIDGALPEAGGDTVAVVLQGVQEAGGLAVRSGTVTIASPLGAPDFVGRITAIEGGILYASPSAQSPTSSPVAVTITNLDLARGAASGSVQVVPGIPGGDREQGGDR
jgi:DMSO/TMAO reductase YedYZ heme-binding membrane subunit